MTQKLIDAYELEREMYRRCIDTDIEIEKGRAKWDSGLWIRYKVFEDAITVAPRVEAESIQPEIIRCKDCKHWRQQTNYQGAPLSFGFCESDDMWQSLYGETNEVAHIDTDDDFYCGYAKRRSDE